ncbi:MAG: YeeE/YedE thiosulfate transporter family protein [Novosphingobium sp.]
MEFLAHTQPLAFAVAMLAAAVMGFSIQQGGTCMVGAIGQLVVERRAGKAIALIECSLWVLALGIAVMATGYGFQASPNYPVGFSVVLGGALLGLGAWANEACVFGSIARIGSRNLNYLLTPPGYFLGSLLHARLELRWAQSAPMTPVSGSASKFMLLLFTASILLSIRQIAAVRRAGTSLQQVWDYRHATIAIGIAFVVLTVLAGPWTYTEALGRYAHGRGMPDLGGLLLLAALLGGAMLGGRGAGAPVQINLRRAATCLVGGALMGFGAALVPGGNDNLILAGLPWLQPHAWLAIGAMALTIATALLGTRLWRKQQPVGFGSRASRI